VLPSARQPLGAPGAYALPDATTVQLHPQRMDVCAFVGVAARGPAWQPKVDAQWPAGWRQVTQPERPLLRSVPVSVRSFDEYLRVFGGFESPGALPHAVASFFEQGGRQAWVVRIVHDRAGASFGDGCALGVLSGAFTQDLTLQARNQGLWGQTLRVEIGLSSTAVSVDALSATDLRVELSSPLVPGACLRLTDATGGVTLAWVDALVATPEANRPRTRWRLQLDTAPATVPVRADLVEAWVQIDDGAGRTEQFEHLALSPEHPQALATVLADRSALVWPHADWAGVRLMPVDVRVERVRGRTGAFTGGDDGHEHIVPSDFFDAFWTPADDEPGSGLMALAPVDAVAVVGTAGITHVVVPDLYVPAQWADPEPLPDATVGRAGAVFGPCVDTTVVPGAQATPPSRLTGLILDPRRSSDLDVIVTLQQQVVDFCEATQALVALLDVPPGLSQSRIEQWRSRFDTSWAAAYHPWLLPQRRPGDGQDPARARRRPLPPSAVAAGIVAHTERTAGLQHGPANAVAQQIIHLAEPQPPGRGDALLPLGLNAFVRDARGIELVSARTLSRDPQWRQLSVRRLMLMLRRTLLVDTQWAVFEPNGPMLWAELHQALTSLLRGLWRAGALVGRTQDEAFFIRMDTAARRLERGELLVEIGVAPSEPLEFILVRLRREGDGTLNFED